MQLNTATILSACVVLHKVELRTTEGNWNKGTVFVTLFYILCGDKLLEIATTPVKTVQAYINFS